MQRRNAKRRCLQGRSGSYTVRESKIIGEDGVEREIKLADKLKALDMLGRHLAMWNDKLQLSGMEEEKSKLDSLIKQISGGG